MKKVIYTNEHLYPELFKQFKVFKNTLKDDNFWTKGRKEFAKTILDFIQNTDNSIVTINIIISDMNVYISNDGKNLFLQLVSLNENLSATYSIKCLWEHQNECLSCLYTFLGLLYES